MAYTKEDKEEIWNSIIEEISSGRSLRSVLRDTAMPSLPTVYQWIEKDEEKAKQYARACEVRADKIFDEILEISDSTDDDIINLDNGKQAINHHVINRDRLRVDARKWALSKMNPKKYGDKVDLSSSDGTMTPKVDVSLLSTDELIKRSQALKNLEQNESSD